MRHTVESIWTICTPNHCLQSTPPQSCLPRQAFFKNDALCNLSFNSNLAETCRHYAQVSNKINMLWMTCSLVCVANGDDDK